MLSYGKVLMLIGCAGLVWYIWGYAIGTRDERRRNRRARGA